MSSWQSQNYYELLEIAPTAGEHEIHEAYQRAKSTYSVDSPALYTMFTAQEAQALNRLIEEAYSVLGNQRLRQEYDSKLQKGEIKQKSEVEKPVEPSPITTNQTQDSGYGKTIFGAFSVNADFEREIQATSQFDGAFLKKIREYKEVTLENIAEHTKINISHLRAIEENNFTALPAPVFVRGFLAQISKILRIDEKRVTKYFIDSYKNSLGAKK